MQTNWNLGLLYANHEDPQVEKDLKAIEKAFLLFEKKYRNRTDYLKSDSKLFAALSDFEALHVKLPLTKIISYFQYSQDLDASDSKARAKATQIMQRMTKLGNSLLFFELALGKIPAPLQKRFLSSKKLVPFRYFLKVIFEKAKHNLSEPEEKVLRLLSVPAYEMWISGTEKILNKKTVEFKGKHLPISEALQKIHDLPLLERRELHEKAMKVLDSVSDVAESELNAIITDKKIYDELKGHDEPFDATLINYENDRRSVMALVDAATKNFSISHRFYALKARLLKLPNLEYSDRNVGIAKNVREVKFDEAVKTLREIFGAVRPKYSQILDKYLENGQIDVYPKVGKTGGAYCSGNLNAPTFVLLNYTDSMDQVMTFAHEMGHAIHTDMSKSQPPLYQNYTISTAEVASTLFESFVFDALFEKLSKEEQIAALHNRINDDIQTIFRQIACFNFEVELHKTVRAKGEISKEEIRTLLNKHMSAYLGPAVLMNEIDGNFFVTWGHIRRFFYVYSYAFGQLISKALHAEYKKDKKFIEKIEKFLNAGGSDSPENIFKSIGIDVTKPDFWIKGLKSIEKDIEKLEKLTQKG
jgi:oligoendopeptidase F